MTALPTTDILRIRARCLDIALDRHSEDDKAFALAERLERWLLRVEERGATEAENGAGLSTAAAPEEISPEPKETAACAPDKAPEGIGPVWRFEPVATPPWPGEAHSPVHNPAPETGSDLTQDGETGKALAEPPTSDFSPSNEGAKINTPLDRPLGDIERRVWIAISKAISRTGLSPSYHEVSDAAQTTYDDVRRIAPRLERQGYIRREGTKRALVIHVVRWPDGIVPRETEQRADGVKARKPVTAPRQRAPQAPAREPVTVERPLAPPEAKKIKGVLESFGEHREKQKAELGAKGPRTCQTPGCNGPKQPGRDHCAACITSKAGPSKRADMVDSYIVSSGARA